MKTTTPIIGIANLADNLNPNNLIRVPKDGNYIPLYLLYGESKYDEKLWTKDQSGSFEAIFNEIIRAVKECENVIIGRAKN